MRTNAPPAQSRARRGHPLLKRFLSTTAVVCSVALLGSTAQPAAPTPTRPAAATGVDPATGYDFDQAVKIRDAQCLMNIMQRRGGQEMKAVARTGLAGTDADLLTAGDPEYYKTPAPPLAVAYDKDKATASAKMDELYDRHKVWETSLNVTPPASYTYTGFQWIEQKDNPFATTGLSGWIADQFWQSEYDLFHTNQAPVAGQDSVDAVTGIVNSRYSEDRYEDYDDWSAWKWEMQFMHPMYADDARIFLQNGGFPTTAPDPDSVEFRIDVEALKARFASCTTSNPIDPHKVLTAETVVASTEWQAEISGQKTQRDRILAAEAAANGDLQVATQALGEALGQSTIASRLADWQAYWLKQPTTNSSYPDAAEFTKVAADIVKAQAMALGRLYVASRAAQSAQTQAAKATAAQTDAYAVADAAGLPRGRGLLYGQQAVQVTKASAAAATAVAKATETASNATRASAADSKTLMALAKTQAHASAAEFRRAAAEEAAAQAKAAADGAAVQATKAAENAAKAKAARVKAEAAEATAKAAAADARAKRATAEAERDKAKAQKDIAASERAKAADANQRAQTQRQVAADKLSAAQTAGGTASAKKDEALAAERRATVARDNAVNAEDTEDALSARADAAESRAAADEGTDAASASRAAATRARTAANEAGDAARAARSAANDATTAAANAREASIRADAAAARAKAASDAAQRDVAITHAAVQKAHAAAADAIAASGAAAENVRVAKALADTAKAKAAEAKANAAIARVEANAAAATAVQTAGFAYATAQAALAARDAAAQVIKPANDAIELGSPYQETDSSAGLAVLSGQAAKTASEQQAALAQAKAAQAAKASTEAAALAAQASADAKAAAVAAAAAAESAAKATKSLAQARASAADAAADAKAAVKSEANTVAYDQQATADAAAAAGAATAASGYADDARASADAAETDAASARSAASEAEADATTASGVADRAEADATAAEASAARAQEAATEAEAAATRAETAANAQSETVRMSETGPAGAQGVIAQPYGVQDTISSDGMCTGTHSGSDVGCEINVTHHITGTMIYLVLTCPLPHATAVECIGSYTADYLDSKPIDFTYDDQIHVDGWKLTAEILKTVAYGMVQDFVGCARLVFTGSGGTGGDCAWAIGSIVVPPLLKVASRYVVALRAAMRTGIGLDQAIYDLRGSGLTADALANLTKTGRAAKAAAAGQCFPPGTPIATADGTKKIEDIKVGDRVWAADPVTGKQTLRRVTQLFHRTADGLVRIDAGGRHVRATPGHPFQVKGKGWVDAGDLEPGDRLEKRDGTTVAVDGVSELPGPAEVFNFEVEADHTYYATDLDVLVHNTCGEYSEIYENGTAILASIDSKGILNTAVEVVKDGTEATAPTGGEMFVNAMNALAKDAEGVRGTWNSGLRDNLDSFNAGIQNMLSPEDAARATFTGKMAVKYGFTKVEIESTVGSPGEYTAVKVVFRR
ncbi:Hint domain-containing protein [Streptomyces sp. NPDC048523]|uniref:Hint domain-containing protein n=1 Tax=Streptomyces sp. NPDC048523 TaxID=3365567 RepID=UPI0037146CD5